MLKRIVLLVILLMGFSAVVQAQDKPQLIEIGQEVSGHIADSSAQNLYQFDAQKGDFLIITVNAAGASVDNLDTTVTVEAGADMSSFVYLYADDTGSSRDPLLPMLVGESGRYTLTVGSYTGEGGDYVLTISRGNAMPITFDAPLDVTFDAEHTAYYFTFSGKANEVVSMRAVGTDNIDTRLEILDVNSNQVAYDDDSGENNNPLINSAVLPQDGEYLVTLLPYALPASGTVTVTLSHSELKSLDDGPVSMTLGDKLFEDVVTFMGTAGEHVRLTITLQAGSSFSPYITFAQDTGGFASVSGLTVQNLSLEVVVPADGLVLVHLENYENATIQIALEHLQ